MIVTRFAPSPNGALHLGHALAAVVAHDRATAGGGTFLLRIEDIDGARSRPELAAQYRADLRWLGLQWHEVRPQSARIDSYRVALERLRARGLVYPCRCTRAEILAAARGTGPDGPVYPGTCRPANRRGEGNRAIAPAGEDPLAWRLDMARAVALAGPLEWTDENRGTRRATPEAFGDVVLWRKDAPASYHLAATLDDAADGVTVVTRGADLFAATHLHRLLQALLHLPRPVWHHHPVLVGPDGRKLAKRRGAAGLADRRAAGEDGKEIAALLRAASMQGVDSRLGTGLSLSDYLDREP